MHASVATAQIQSGKMDETIRVFQEIASEIQIPGMKGSYLLTDRETNTVMTVTLYETEADANAVEASAKFQEGVGRLAGVMDGQPTRKIYEVSIQV